jgi:uncharacterized protein YcbK (DUF882 family)
MDLLIKLIQALISFFKKDLFKKYTDQLIKQNEAIMKTLQDAEKEIKKISQIGNMNIITSDMRHPDRFNSASSEVLNNATLLAEKLNLLLSEIEYDGPLLIVSGYRPPEVNAKVGGAKRSAHMTGEAVDLLDDKYQSLYHAIYAEGNGELLRKHGLFMENGAYTKGQNTNWVHIDMKPRKDRKDRTFIP